MMCNDVVKALVQFIYIFQVAYIIYYVKTFTR